MVFLVDYPPWKFLWIPSWQDAILVKLRQSANDFEDVDVVILPVVTTREKKQAIAFLEDFVRTVQPHLFTLPHHDDDITFLLENYEMRVVNLDQSGALTFTLEQHSAGKIPFQNAYVSRLVINSKIYGVLQVLG